MRPRAAELKAVCLLVDQWWQAPSPSIHLSIASAVCPLGRVRKPARRHQRQHTGTPPLEQRSSISTHTATVRSESESERHSRPLIGRGDSGGMGASAVGRRFREELAEAARQLDLKPQLPPAAAKPRL